jgi:glucosamine--fructose-6-phosphate aminotransferase (isomerizing)
VIAADRLLVEIHEQPAVLDRQRYYGDATIELGERLRREPPRLIRFAGHGTSDNAATFGVYAFGVAAGMTAFRDSVSLPTYVGVPSDARGDLAIGLSQSGETPDIVEWLVRMGESGARTVAITNASGSQLAEAAETVLELGAGEEHSIAATKTYTAELATLARLAAYAGGAGAELDAGLAVTAERLAIALPDLAAPVGSLAAELAEIDRITVIGRGPEYATARETALKLSEVCRISAVALTSTDLAHGPLAALDERVPVWACAAADPMLDSLVEAAARIADTGAPLVAVGPAAARIGSARWTLGVPEPGHPLLSPLLTVAPGQLFAHALAERKGLDADAPPYLRKITLAR